MTKEDKELLLLDLCSRLFYQPKLQIHYEEMSGSGYFDEELWEIDIDGQYCNSGRRMEDIKPYLRPMSSMTDEEENEYRAINCYEGLFPRNEDALDYVLSHHFDYRGLIEKSLALIAPEGMYVIN